MNCLSTGEAVLEDGYGYQDVDKGDQLNSWLIIAKEKIANFEILSNYSRWFKFGLLKKPFLFKFDIIFNLLK